MINFDHLDSTKFEEFVYDLLREMWFFNINRRKGTWYNASPADQGRDIECMWAWNKPGWGSIESLWYIECKHYKKWIPAEKIQNATAYALSKRPDALVIVCSNFLSNSAKEYIDRFIENNRPYTRIYFWENKDLENHLSQFHSLLLKYNLSIS